jgi:hypothetical protein
MIDNDDADYVFYRLPQPEYPASPVINCFACCRSAQPEGFADKLNGYLWLFIEQIQK